MSRKGNVPARWPGHVRMSDLAGMRIAILQVFVLKGGSFGVEALPSHLGTAKDVDEEPLFGCIPSFRV